MNENMIDSTLNKKFKKPDSFIDSMIDTMESRKLLEDKEITEDEYGIIIRKLFESK